MFIRTYSQELVYKYLYLRSYLIHALRISHSLCLCLSHSHCDFTFCLIIENLDAKIGRTYLLEKSYSFKFLDLLDAIFGKKTRPCLALDLHSFQMFTKLGLLVNRVPSLFSYNFISSKIEIEFENLSTIRVPN